MTAPAAVGPDAAHITLILTGLRAAWPEARRQRPPALARLLARAQPAAPAAPPWPAAIFAAFGLPSGSAESLPIAAVTRALDLPETPGRWWLRADPVSLTAGLADVVLQAGAELELTHAEARALADEVNAALATPGPVLHVGAHPTRWYIRLEAPADLRARDPERLSGLPVRGHLPSGADRLRWLAYAGEAQMVLHGAALNRERIAARRPPVNGLWCWGAGATPEPVRPTLAAVAGADAIARGLAALAQVPVLEPAALPEVPGARLLVWHASAANLAELEAVVERMLGLLGRPTLRSLEVVLDGERRVLSRAGLWRFWRRAVELSVLS